MKKSSGTLLLVLVSAISTAVPALAAATTYYVSPTGNDSNSGALALPWKTLTHAISAVAAGDTIQARAGTYNERVVITKSLTLQSYPNELATIDGTGVAMASGPYAYGLVDINSGLSNVTVSGLEIRNFITTNASFVPAGVHMEGSGSNIQIQNLSLIHI